MCESVQAPCCAPLTPVAHVLPCSRVPQISCLIFPRVISYYSHLVAYMSQKLVQKVFTIEMPDFHEGRDLCFICIYVHI